MLLYFLIDKPTETQLTVPSSEVKKGEPLDITCTARANPSPEYKFYRAGKLIKWSSKAVLSFLSVKSEDEGTYRCIPVNDLGDGPEASVTVTVDGKSILQCKLIYALFFDEVFELWTFKRSHHETRSKNKSSRERFESKA